MDSNKDSLADISKLAEESNGVESCLSIETRSRLIQEYQDGGFGDKFDTDSDTLALLNRQAISNTSNQSMLEIVKLKEVDNSLDVCNLLLARCVTALTKQRRELECFADGGEGFVNIELFAVAGRSLERHREGSTIDENLTTNGAFCFLGRVSEVIGEDGNYVTYTLSQNIEECRLSGT